MSLDHSRYHFADTLLDWIQEPTERTHQRMDKAAEAYRRERDGD